MSLTKISEELTQQNNQSKLKKPKELGISKNQAVFFTQNKENNNSNNNSNNNNNMQITPFCGKSLFT